MAPASRRGFFVYPRSHSPIPYVLMAHGIMFSPLTRLKQTIVRRRWGAADER